MGKRVLFISTHGIGDIAMQFRAMGKSFISFEMTFVVTGDVEAKFVQYYYPSAIVYVIKRNRGLIRMAALWIAINRRRYDYVFAQYNVNLAKFFFFTLFLTNKYVISDKSIANLLSTKLFQGKLHKIDAMAQWGAVVDSSCISTPRFEESVFAKNYSLINACNTSDRPLKILLAISSFEKESYKRWPLRHYADLCGILAKEHDVSFELYGSQTEFEYGEKLVSLLDGISIKNSCGKIAFEDVLKEIPNFDFAICNCNAFSHISSLSGVPTVAIYGPTDPGITGIYDHSCNLLIRSRKTCSPCYGKGGPCLMPTCMEEVSVDSVGYQVQEFIRSSIKL